MPIGKKTITADDFFQKKEWHVLSLMGSMLPEPYTGLPGVEQVQQGVYRVTTRASSDSGILDVTLTLRLMESFDQTKLVFSPLLDAQGPAEAAGATGAVFCACAASASGASSIASGAG